MSKHPGPLTIDREISAEEALGLGQPAVDAVEVSKKRRPGLRRLLLAGAGAAALAAAGHFGWDYWTVGRFHVSTDDAYVQADNITIAPKVSGYIAEVLVGDNEPVKAGQVLARIDDRDFRVALDQAKADVAAARGRRSPASRPPSMTQQSTIEAAQATVSSTRPTQTFAEQDDKRYADLAATGYGSVQNAQQAAARIAAARAAVAARHGRARRGDQAGRPAEGRARAGARRRWRATQAVQRQAELNLSYTTITAPGRRRRRQPHAARRPVRPGRHAADVRRADSRPSTSSRTTRRRSSPTCGPASRSRSRSTCSPAGSSTAMSTASRRRAARNSPCCRPTTPPATSPRSSSASR